MRKITWEKKQQNKQNFAEKGNASTIVLWQISLYLFDKGIEFVQYNNWKWEKSPLPPPNYYQRLCNEFEKFHYWLVTLLFAIKRNCANKDNKGKGNGKAFCMDSRIEIKIQHQLTTSLLTSQCRSVAFSSAFTDSYFRGTQQKECRGSRNKIAINSAASFDSQVKAEKATLMSKKFDLPHALHLREQFLSLIKY